MDKKKRCVAFCGAASHTKISEKYTHEDYTFSDTRKKRLSPPFGGKVRFRKKRLRRPGSDGAPLNVLRFFVVDDFIV
ncbi:hypothetical protein K0U00_46775, partial [Paenibacillus sepulcri]|nr:hypothetical protein [Paenibacillus sepulcri]